MGQLAWSLRGCVFVCVCVCGRGWLGFDWYVCSFPWGAERGVFNAYCFIQTEVLIVWASILPLSHTLRPDGSQCLTKMSLFLHQQGSFSNLVVAFSLRFVQKSTIRHKGYHWHYHQIPIRDQNQHLIYPANKFSLFKTTAWYSVCASELHCYPKAIKKTLNSHTIALGVFYFFDIKGQRS